MANRKGDRTPPCLTPRAILKILPRTPFHNTAHCRAASYTIGFKQLTFHSHRNTGVDDDCPCVCCRVGGINTVLRTKAAVSMDEMGDQYCMIGPFVEKGVKMEVEVEDPVKHEPMAAVIQKMKDYGFTVR